MTDKNPRERTVLSVLFEITQQLNENATLESVLEKIAERVCSLLSAETSSVMLFDESHSALLCRASHGLPPDESNKLSFSAGEGIAGWVANTGEAVVLGDAHSDERFKDLPNQTTDIQSMVCVPLQIRDAVIGVITVTASRESRFTDADRDLLSLVAASVVKDVENARLYRLAVTDNLTKCYNRQYLAKRLPAEIDRAARYQESVALILIDVDEFKSVNDTWGHDTGDKVLRRIADICRECVRDVDTVVRYGGDEFVVLLPSTDTNGALQVANRICADVGNASLNNNGDIIKTSVSAGVHASALGALDGKTLINRADQAMYTAKKAGGNQVSLAEDN